MSVITNKRVYLALFVLWVTVWLHFMIRDFILKKYFKEYVVLLARDSLGKKSYTYGDDFFAYLNFCKKNIPEQSSYQILGIKDGTLEASRARYHLYPSIVSDNPEYLLVFNNDDYVNPGFQVFKKFEGSGCILIRENK